MGKHDRTQFSRKGDLQPAVRGKFSYKQPYIYSVQTERFIFDVHYRYHNLLLILYEPE